LHHGDGVAGHPATTLANSVDRHGLVGGLRFNSWSLLTVDTRGERVAAGRRQITNPKKAVVQWLLDADPSMRFQVQRQLTSEPEGVVAAERSRVAVVGWGARLRSIQDPDGNRGGGPWVIRSWASTLETPMQLRELGLDPASAQARRATGFSANGYRMVAGTATLTRASGPLSIPPSASGKDYWSMRRRMAPPALSRMLVSAARSICWSENDSGHCQLEG